jgi:hypothetical protein
VYQYGVTKSAILSGRTKTVDANNGDEWGMFREATGAHHSLIRSGFTARLHMEFEKDKSEKPDDKFLLNTCYLLRSCHGSTPTG